MCVGCGSNTLKMAKTAGSGCAVFVWPYWWWLFGAMAGEKVAHAAPEYAACNAPSQGSAERPNCAIPSPSSNGIWERVVTDHLEG